MLSICVHLFGHAWNLEQVEYQQGMLSICGKLSEATLVLTREMSGWALGSINGPWALHCIPQVSRVCLGYEAVCTRSTPAAQAEFQPGGRSVYKMSMGSACIPQCGIRGFVNSLCSGTRPLCLSPSRRVEIFQCRILFTIRCNRGLPGRNPVHHHQ